MYPIRFKRLLPLLIAAFLLMGLLDASVFASEGNDVSYANGSTEPQLGPIQVFDVAAGKVVKTMPNDDDFQKMAKAWTSSVTELAPQITADQNCGYVFRVPLATPASITTGELTVTANDLFLFYCKDKPPIILVFDKQRKPFLYLFNADIAPFIKKVGLPPSTN